MKGKIVALFMAAAFAFGALGFAACGKDGKDGADGKDGVGIAGVYIDENGNLIVKLTDGTEINAGNIPDLFPTAPTEKGFEYSEVKEGGVVTGYSLSGIGSVSQEAIVIPSEYNGKPVVEIAQKAFYENENITSVTIPDSVKYIGKNAFYNCTNLKKAYVGDGVTVIGELAFADCFQLTAVKLGESVVTVGDYAFSQCFALNGIKLPSSVETIGECAFVSCTSLESVELNDGLKTIGDCAFGGCTSLTSFIMPDSVTSLGWGGLMFDVSSVGFAPANPTTNCLTEIVISNNLTELPDFAFSKSNISGIKIGNNVKTIRYSAFYGCGLLESVIIPKSVTRIESYAFYSCAALKSVYYEGTAEEWSAIKIGKNGNEFSIESGDYGKVNYYSATRPAAEGNYWHYVDGVPTKW